MGGCNCGKPKPGPHGHDGPKPASMTASLGRAMPGEITHVAPDGSRTIFPDILGARAEVVRRGGRIDIG